MCIRDRYGKNHGLPAFALENLEKKDHQRDGRKTMNDRKIHMLKKEVVFYF